MITKFKIYEQRPYSYKRVFENNTPIIGDYVVVEGLEKLIGKITDIINYSYPTGTIYEVEFYGTDNFGMIHYDTREIDPDDVLCYSNNIKNLNMCLDQIKFNL